MKSTLDDIIKELNKLNTDEKIEAINHIKEALHEISPMKDEPVDCVIWVKNDTVIANNYNPNKVAPIEMNLLKVSIGSDGYTQPIVTFPEDDKRIVVDGFHRKRVGTECEEITKRVHGYLPVTTIRADREDRGDRIAATIRHNRARGKHQISAMSDIIVELKRRFWSDEKIGKELGMDPDEVLRLAQITGLRDAFLNVEFSKAWEPVEIAEQE
jgi:ParB-like chromosome segregation protein Spo0J